MRKLNLLWALLVSALFVVGCNPDTPGEDNPTPGGDPGAKPEITLTQTEVTFDTFSFEVTTTVAGTLGYAVVAEGYDAPKIDELYSLNSVEVKTKSMITIENLNDNTNYTLYAVLRTGNQQSAPKTLKFRTLDDGKVSPIVIHSATYDTISFSINISGSYVFHCIDKSYLEYNNLTIEEYVTMEGIAIPSKGEISVDWINGGMYGVWPMRVREDSDYYVIAAIAEGQTVVGEIFYATTHTPKRPEATADVATELSNVTSNSVNIKTTPDNNVKDYYVLVRTKAWSDDIIENNGGESILATLVAYTAAGSWNLTAANEAVWSGLEPGTEHICHILVNDKKGAKALRRIPFTTLEATSTAPVVEASLTPAAEDGYNTLNLNLYSADAAIVKIASNTKADLDLERKKGLTDAEIAERLGVELGAEQVAAIRTTGLTLRQEDLFPEVEYVAIISVKNAEKIETVKVTSAKTTAKPIPARVESDLFTSLLGKWEVSYALVQFNSVDVTIYNAEVTIAQGADDATADYYRSHNRLVIQGWPFNVEADGTYVPVPYSSPTDLKNDSSYWANNPQLALRDYGPKVFLEIGEGDVVTVPSSRGEYLYNWALHSFYFFGADIENEFTAPATFPVTVYEDGDTIVIGACQSGAEFDCGIYRPAVFRYGTEAWGLATGDIILKRVK